MGLLCTLKQPSSTIAPGYPKLLVCCLLALFALISAWTWHCTHAEQHMEDTTSSAYVPLILKRSRATSRKATTIGIHRHIWKGSAIFELNFRFCESSSGVTNKPVKPKDSYLQQKVGCGVLPQIRGHLTELTGWTEHSTQTDWRGVAATAHTLFPVLQWLLLNDHCLDKKGLKVKGERNFLENYSGMSCFKM